MKYIILIVSIIILNKECAAQNPYNQPIKCMKTTWPLSSNAPFQIDTYNKNGDPLTMFRISANSDTSQNWKYEYDSIGDLRKRITERDTALYAYIRTGDSITEKCTFFSNGKGVLQTENTEYDEQGRVVGTYVLHSWGGHDKWEMVYEYFDCN